MKVWSDYNCLTHPYTCPKLWLNLLWSEIGHLHPISNPDKQCMGYFFRLHVAGFKEWSLRFDLRGAVESGFLGEICLSLLTSGGTIDQAIWDKRCTQTGITCKGDKQIFLCNYWPKPSTYCLFIEGLGQWVHLWFLSDYTQSEMPSIVLLYITWSDTLLLTGLAKDPNFSLQQHISQSRSVDVDGQPQPGAIWSSAKANTRKHSRWYWMNNIPGMLLTFITLCFYTDIEDQQR